RAWLSGPTGGTRSGGEGGRPARRPRGLGRPGDRARGRTRARRPPARPPPPKARPPPHLAPPSGPRGGGGQRWPDRAAGARGPRALGRRGRARALALLAAGGRPLRVVARGPRRSGPRPAPGRAGGA